MTSFFSSLYSFFNVFYLCNEKNVYLHQCQDTLDVEEEKVDDRSVDDLLSFINGNDSGIL